MPDSPDSPPYVPFFALYPFLHHSHMLALLPFCVLEAYISPEGALQPFSLPTKYVIPPTHLSSIPAHCRQTIGSLKFPRFWPLLGGRALSSK